MREAGVETNLTNNAANEGSPTFFPDGSKIAFTSLRDGSYDIFAVNAKTREQKRLTTNLAADSQPNWQPLVK